MRSEPYATALSEAAKLKLRAKSLLVEGDPFKSAVLFYHAARSEAKALQVLDGPPVATQLASLAEQCWCLLDGFDPPGAATLWGRLLTIADSGEDARAITTKVRRRFKAEIDRFRSLYSKHRTLQSGRLTTFAPSSPTERRRLQKELKSMLNVFPGIPHLWWALYRVADADGRLKDAWTMLGNADELDPYNPAFEAMRLWLAPQAVNETEASRILDSAFLRIQTQQAHSAVCLNYALAELALAKRKPSDERLRRAQHSVFQGLSRAPYEKLRKYLSATGLMLDAKLAGQEFTVDILYRAGLGEIVSEMNVGTAAEIVHVLTGRAKAVTQDLPEVQAA
jgi:hypothetical protein